MFLIEKYNSVEKFPDQTAMLKEIKESLQTIADNYFADKQLFSKNNYSIYYYDDFVFNTNVSNVINLYAYLELDQPKNFKDGKIAKTYKDVNLKDANLKLKDIKYDIINYVINNYNNTVRVGIANNQYSVILIQDAFIDNQHLQINITFTPCFTHENENNVKGVIYYNNNCKNIEIEYPKISIKNFKKKNKDTKNLYQAYVLIFKNIYKEAKSEKVLPTEIFEILLYNVPDSIFNDLSLKNIYDILNYLRNKGLRSIKTLDEQDNAFLSKYRSLSYLYAKNILAQIEKHIKKLT